MKVMIETGGPSVGLFPFLSGFKTYGVVLAAFGYVGWCRYYDTQLDPKVLALFGFGSLAALRSAAAAMVAQVVNAQVNPGSPAAQATAAQATTPVAAGPVVAVEPADHTAAGIPTGRIQKPSGAA